MSEPPVPLPPALPATARPAAAYTRAGDAARLPGRLAGLPEWCQLAGQTALLATPETVADHLTSLATTSAACVRWLAADAWAIARAGHSAVPWPRPWKQYEPWRAHVGRNGTGQVDREGQDPSMNDVALPLMVMLARQSSPYERAASLRGPLRAVSHRRSRPGCAAGSEPAALQLRLSPDL